MRKLRVAVIGCGAVSEIYHLPALRRAAEATLSALVDADVARARALAERLGAPPCFADHRALPDDTDAAIVATSNTSHVEIGCHLLERGIHVLCEKPMATTVADAERLVAAAARGGARLMAAHSRRFNPNIQMMRSLVRQGSFGCELHLTAGLGSRYGSWPQRTEFRRQRHLSGGGVLLDLGIHLIDLALWIAGREVSVIDYQASDHLGWGVENDAEVVLALPGGGRAVLSCSYTHGLDRTLRVRGEGGWAQTSVDGAPRLTMFSASARICKRAGAQHLVLPERDCYRDQLDHFVGAILRDEEFLVDTGDVIAGLEVVGRCYRVAHAA